MDRLVFNQGHNNNNNNNNSNIALAARSIRLARQAQLLLLRFSAVPFASGTQEHSTKVPAVGLPRQAPPKTMPVAEPTDDGHHVVIYGRKWRATDPGIPAKLKQELVNELMAARRAVKNNEADARPRVSDAKVALGERGHPWWEPTGVDERAQRYRAVIKTLLRARGDGKSICPSEVARIVGGDVDDSKWRPLMPEVRSVAGALVSEGWALITQRGQTVDLDTVRGPVRIIQASGHQQTLPTRKRAQRSDSPTSPASQPAETAKKAKLARSGVHKTQDLPVSARTRSHQR